MTYTIELGIAGYIDNPNNLSTPAERVIALSERVQYWKDLPWTTILSQRVTEGFASASDMRLSRGIFSRLTMVDEPGPAGPVKKVYELQFLKSRMDEVDRDPVRFDLPSGHMVLVLDPGQDLLVSFVRAQ